jgi:hypothetical protein
VILGSGHFGEYRWGSTRKLAILGREAAAAHVAADEDALARTRW